MSGKRVQAFRSLDDAGVIGVALASYEWELLERAKRGGWSAPLQDLLGSTRSVLRDYNLALGCDPAQSARVRAGFPA